MDRRKDVSRFFRKVRKWLKERASAPHFKEFYEESKEGLLLYAEQKSSRLNILDIETVYFQHLVHFEQAVLNEASEGHVDLALAVRYAETHIHFEAAFAEANRGGPVLKNQAALYFSVAVIADWKETAHRIGQALVRGLDTPLLDLRHTDRHRAGEVYRHFWFIMHLYAKAGGREFDTALYSYPPDMSPYENVLDDWLTTDLTKVQDWVCAMADYHVQEARNTAHAIVDEFDAEDVMLFPYEILCWLRLREWAGRENPDSFDHPLMQQPLAQLPTPSPLEVPATPLLDQVVDRFRQEFPDSFPGWLTP